MYCRLQAVRSTCGLLVYNKIGMCTCACERARACACACVHVCVCARVYCIYYACVMYNKYSLLLCIISMSLPSRTYA